MLGKDLSPEKFAEALPKLLEMLEDDMDDDDFYEDDDDRDFSIPQILFGGKKSSQKSNKGFR
jgi:hypothetical protein